MHEIDIARDLVDLAGEAAARAGADRVSVVRVRVGALSGVEGGALRAAWPDVTLGSVAEGALLVIVDVPLVVWCAFCLRDVRPPAINHLVCPSCGTAAGEVREGQELELESLEVDS
jgi:hydrogenase nickel incorporation protein HypA/HybF